MPQGADRSWSGDQPYSRMGAVVSMSVAVYIVVMAVISFGAVYLITETYEDEMSEEIGGEEGGAAG